MPVIRSFLDRDAEKLFNDQFSKKYKAIERTARRKLLMLDAAETLTELAARKSLGTTETRPARTAQHSNQRSIPNLLRVVR